jgi:aspartyl-tRNA(Asn)/glutamyl-tRNA(Gln) amidotransferase subunit C
MHIDQATLQKIAHLARLSFDPQAEEKMQKDMAKVLDWAAQLQEVDTDVVAPLTNMSSEITVWREDEVGPSWTQAEALKNAPKQVGSFFSVPKVME